MKERKEGEKEQKKEGKKGVEGKGSPLKWWGWGARGRDT